VKGKSVEIGTEGFVGGLGAVVSKVRLHLGCASHFRELEQSVLRIWDFRFLAVKLTIRGFLIFFIYLDKDEDRRFIFNLQLCGYFRRVLSNRFF
jgi:hypothetical protein